MVFKHFCIRSAELNVFGVEEMTLVSRGKESDVSQRFSHYSLVSGCELMSVDVGVPVYLHYLFLPLLLNTFCFSLQGGSALSEAIDPTERKSEHPAVSPV